MSDAPMPIFDKNGGSTDIRLGVYVGDLEVRNVTAGSVVIDMVRGCVVIHSSCSGGQIAIRGLAQITDHSTGSQVDRG